MIDSNDAELLNRLRADEGLRLKPYHCSANRLTIGYGRNLDDVGISEHEADVMLHADARSAYSVASGYPYFPALTPTRQRVVTEMAFQLGGASFARFRKMHAALEAADYAEAAAEMLDSKWAREDTPERAQRAARRMLHG